MVENQLPATIWLKLPPNVFTLLTPYLQDECVKKVYIYGESSSSTLYQKTVYLTLDHTSALVNDCFILIKSTRLTGLLFAKQKDLNAFELTCSFEVSLCEKFLKKLQNAISINDHTSQEVITRSSCDLENWLPNDIQILSNLFLRQTQAIIDAKREDNFTEVQGNFLHELTEEMRVPLTNMKTALSLLQSPALKIQQRQRYLDLLEQQWQCQYSLWSALVEWVEIEEIFNNPNSTLASCELELVLINIVSLYHSTAQEKQIKLTYTIPPGLPKIKCPEFALVRILTHLLDNSFKFTPPGGKISISCSESSNYFELVVQDTGIGIRNNELSKIFDSFYQGHNAQKNSFAVGLGLTLVKLLLQHCKGSVKVKSQPNEGSSFKVILPLSSY